MVWNISLRFSVLNGKSEWLTVHNGMFPALWTKPPREEQPHQQLNQIKTSDFSPNTFDYLASKQNNHQIEMPYRTWLKPIYSVTCGENISFLKIFQKKYPISSSRFARTMVAPLEIASVELNPELQDTQFTCDYHATTNSSTLQICNVAFLSFEYLKT